MRTLTTEHAWLPPSSKVKLSVLEVKGIKQMRGGVMFTDREWSEATARRSDYWLIVVGNLEANPIARLIPDPTAARHSLPRPGGQRRELSCGKSARKEEVPADL